MASTIKSYAEQLQFLTETKNRLLNDINEIKEQEVFDNAKDRATGRSLFFKRLPADFLKSVYHTRRKELIELISATMEPNVLRDTIGRMKYDGRTMEYDYFVFHCYDVKKTPDGIILKLEDPYRKIETTPIAFDNKEQEKIIIQSSLKRMLKVKMQVTEEILTKTSFAVEKIIPLGLTLTGVYIEGLGERSIKNEDYEELNYITYLKGYDACHQALLDFAIKKEKNGAYYCDTEDIIYIRDEYKEYYFLLNMDSFDCIIYEIYGMTADEKEECKKLCEEGIILASLAIQNLIESY